MIAYFIIMFIAATMMLVVGSLVHSGKTELIHDYHQTRVKDKMAYGKAMGKALAGISIPLIAAGIIALFASSFLLTLILVLDLIISIIPLFFVEKRYSGGVY